MLTFVKVMQDYIKNQVLDVSWQEFNHELKVKVKSCDGLYEAHCRYIEKVLFRLVG